MGARVFFTELWRAVARRTPAFLPQGCAPRRIRPGLLAALARSTPAFAGAAETVAPRNARGEQGGGDVALTGTVSTRELRRAIRRKDLSDVDLPGVELRGVQLSGADL